MKAIVFKSLFKMAAIMAVFTTILSSEKDEVITIDFPGQSAPEVDKRYLTFELGESTKEVKVYYQENWNYKVDEDWVHATRDDNRLTIQVDDNRTKETRECLITVSASNDSNKKTNVKVSQYTSLIIVSCSESELNFNAYEGDSPSRQMANGKFEAPRNGSVPQFREVTATSPSRSRPSLLTRLPAAVQE